MLKIIFGNIVRKPKMSSELVVVPLCFELKLIKHRGGGASLSDVGLCKMSMPTLAKRTKPCGVSSLTGYKV